MNKTINTIFLFLTFISCGIFGQSSFFSGSDFEFNDDFVYSLAINNDLTDNHFQLERKKLKIKTVIHTTKLTNNPDSIKFAKGTAFNNINKRITTFHFSTKEAFSYDTNGIMISFKAYPLLNNYTIDTSHISNTSSCITEIINNDNYKNIFTFCNKICTEKKVYRNGLLVKDSTDEGCYIYNYNNNKIGTVFKNGKLLLEYKYSKNKYIVKKYQYYEKYKDNDTLQIFYNTNELSNNSKIIKSTFSILNSPAKTSIMFQFDKNGQVIDSKRKLDYEKETELITEYRNIYKNNQLFQILNKPDKEQQDPYIFTFEKNGFIEKIETNFSTETFEFENF